MEKEKSGMGNSIWNRLYTCVFTSNVLLFLGMQIVNTLVSKYADYLGATATVVGVVSSLFALSSLLLKVISGPAIDAFNRKYILIAAITVIAISFFGFSISSNVPMILAFRLLQGCGQAFTATCCLALVADALPAEKFGVGIGTFTLAQAICQAVGPMAGLALADQFGYRIAFVIAALCTSCAIFSASLIQTPEREYSKFKICKRNIFAREAVLPAVLLFLLQMTSCNINSFLVIYADRLGVENIGLFFTVYAITMLFAPTSVGRLADRYGTVRALIPAMTFFAISFLLISFSSSLPMFLLAAVVSAFGYGAAQPAVQALGMKFVSKERRGAASSTSYIGQDLGNLLGPILAGIIVEKFGYPAMWRLMIIPVILAIVLTVLQRDRIIMTEERFYKKI